MTANAYVNFRGCMHGLSAEHVRLHRDEGSDAIYIELDKDGDLGIRIQVRPGRYEEPARHAAGLERDRQGLLQLAALAGQLAEEIRQQQEGGPR